MLELLLEDRDDPELLDLLLDELDERELLDLLLDELDERELLDLLLDELDELELDERELLLKELDDCELLELLLDAFDGEPLGDPTRVAWFVPPDPSAERSDGDVGVPPLQPTSAPPAVTRAAPPDSRIRKSRRLACEASRPAVPAAVSFTIHLAYRGRAGDAEAYQTASA